MKKIATLLIIALVPLFAGVAQADKQPTKGAAPKAEMEPVSAEKNAEKEDTKGPAVPALVRAPNDDDAPPVPSPPTEWSPLQGEWPENLRKVSITMNGGTIADALQSVSKQLGYGLVLSAPEPLTMKKLIMRLVRAPAKIVMEVVLENSGLEAELKNDIIFIRPSSSIPDAHGQVPITYPTPAIQLHTGPGTRGITINEKKHGHKQKHNHDDGDDDDGDDVVKMGQSLHIEAGQTVGDAVVIGGSLTISGTVEGEATAVGGSVTLKPTAVVEGDATAVGGSITVEPGAVVEGEATSVGGIVNVHPGATVEGDQTGVTIPFGSMFSKGDKDSSPMSWIWPASLFTAFGVLAVLLRSVLLFVVALLIILIIPKRVTNVTNYLAQKPFFSLFGGFALFLLFIPIVVLFAITIIGIPLIPILIIALLLLIAVGLTSLLTWFGRKIPFFRNKTPLVAMLLGLVVFMLINLIPVVGSIILAVALFIAAGAAFLSRFGSDSASPAEE